ncbi:unnamed protein product [Lepeophtheirus salmonis]|uniref:(salmon louse) hypothetical protein n=1 Tax=Lepeophtheirus salmonis TaxID=72036 RepID=A0A7R8CLA6_LEPSM|nr:unnamed protein product [Lepeophtheirus salmonis]CAF2855055.1 unnamed protein product [Lepeophtheirus salmonis]
MRRGFIVSSSQSGPTLYYVNVTSTTIMALDEVYSAGSCPGESGCQLQNLHRLPDDTITQWGLHAFTCKWDPRSYYFPPGPLIQKMIKHSGECDYPNWKGAKWLEEMSEREAKNASGNIGEKII